MSDTLIYAHPRWRRAQGCPNQAMRCCRVLVLQQYRWMRRDGIPAERARDYVFNCMFIGSIGWYVSGTTAKAVA